MSGKACLYAKVGTILVMFAGTAEAQFQVGTLHRYSGNTRPTLSWECGGAPRFVRSLTVTALFLPICFCGSVLADHSVLPNRVSPRDAAKTLPGAFGGSRGLKPSAQRVIGIGSKPEGDEHGQGRIARWRKRSALGCGVVFPGWRSADRAVVDPGRF